MVGYVCLDSFLMTPMAALAEVCSALVCSISSILHDGALRKWPGRPPPQLESRLSVSALCLQPVTAILKAPSAASVAQWGVSVSAKPTSLASTVTGVPQEVTASEPTAVQVSFCEVEAHTHSRLA